MRRKSQQQWVTPCEGKGGLCLPNYCHRSASASAGGPSGQQPWVPTPRSGVLLWVALLLGASAPPGLPSPVRICVPRRQGCLILGSQNKPPLWAVGCGLGPLPGRRGQGQEGMRGLLFLSVCVKMGIDFLPPRQPRGVKERAAPLGGFLVTRFLGGISVGLCPSPALSSQPSCLKAHPSPPDLLWPSPG